MRFDTIGLILIFIIIIIVIVPLLFGMGVASVFDFTGMAYHMTTFAIAVLIWLLIGVYYYH